MNSLEDLIVFLMIVYIVFKTNLTSVDFEMFCEKREKNYFFSVSVVFLTSAVFFLFFKVLFLLLTSTKIQLRKSKT